MKTRTRTWPVRLPVCKPGWVHVPKKGHGSYDRKREQAVDMDEAEARVTEDLRRTAAERPGLGLVLELAGFDMEEG